MVYSTPDEYFKTIDKNNLPVLAGELQHHARGCYSACTFVKANNRKCENNILTAEKLSVMAKHLAGTAYPKKKLNKAWKNLMFNQFHDIMGGCSIKKAYEDAGYLYGEIMSITEQEINFAMQSITHKIDTLCGEELPSYKEDGPYRWHIWEHEVLGTPVVVFNPHAWPVKMPVEINEVVRRMEDEKGNEIPFQIVRGDQTNGGKDKYHTVFIAEVEPMGYVVYRIYMEKEKAEVYANELKASETVLENSLIRVDFSKKTGDICSIYDKLNNRNIVTGECSAVILDETACDTWAHDKKYLGEPVGRFENPKFSVLETGPVRAVLRVKTSCQNSFLQRDYILEAGADAVKVNVCVDFQEKHRTLKFKFPSPSGRTLSKIPFGTILRENEQGEEPCGSWLASGGLGIANDGKYGYDTYKNEVGLTILRSAIYADHFGLRDEFCEYMDLGVHRCSYMLFPYENNATAEKKAEELNVGLRYVTDSFHAGTLGERASCVNCSADHIVITAVKESEDSEADMIRFYETDGKEDEINIRIFDNKIQTRVSANEIKTFRTDGEEKNLIEW
jgi:alpha-mannosidase